MAHRVRHLARGRGRVVGRSVDHSLVDAVPENRGRAVDHRFNEQDSIKLVDVVLVDDRLIKPAKAGGDARRQLRTAAVEQICSNHPTPATLMETPMSRYSSVRSPASGEVSGATTSPM